MSDIQLESMSDSVFGLQTSLCPEAKAVKMITFQEFVSARNAVSATQKSVAANP